MNNRPKPFALIILDGWGCANDDPYNAISAAKTPHWDSLLENYTHTLLATSGKAVGLPSGQMGNSEVGHLNLGAGRTVYQDLMRINQSIESGDFFQNPLLTKTLSDTADHDKTLHIIGLLSPGGIHSQQDHLLALVKLATQSKLKKVFIHAILDGRDMPPKSALDCVSEFEKQLSIIGIGKIASVTGRYYAMDRDKRWQRTELAFQLLVDGKTKYHADSASQAIQMAYDRGETDEFVLPTAIQPAVIDDGDSVVFMNFRADRARQLCYALTQAEFSGFQRSRLPRIQHFVTLTEYDTQLNASVVFPSLTIKNGLGEVLSQQHLQQLRIAETEKYAHVTFFFNGGVETPYPNEQRLLIPSPKVATYDLQPEMSAPELTDKLVEAIGSGKFDVIICNYANADMVGHTGNFAAAVIAIETIDTCLGRIAQALNESGGEAFITADHGNAESMFNQKTGQAHTAHTMGPVPLLYIGREAEVNIEDGTLADVAPTLLRLLGIEIPSDMTGRVLLTVK